MTEFKPDEIVDITIKGARVTNTYGTGRGRAEAPEDTGTVLVFRMDGSRYDHSHSVNMGDPGVTVERVAPAEWPPQVGDLWRDNGNETWFVFRNVDVLMLPTRPVSHSMGGVVPHRVMNAVGPLTLVYREENQS